MTWGIIGALDAEIALIKDRMEHVTVKEICGCTYYTGVIGKQEVVAVCCSVGTINAALCASIIIRELGAQAVVNVGIAGSACKELRILDVVVSDEVIFHDADLDIMVKYYPFRRSFPADEKLRELCLKAMEVMPNRSFRYRVGKIASGDVFVNSAQEKNRIVSAVDPACIEMEGAAIGQAAYCNGTPFLVIRTLSDNADDDADESYDDFLGLAAHNSASIVLEMLRLADNGK